MQHGIELKVKHVQEFASGEKKADWDVGMAVDAMAIAMSGRVDAVILVTGDGDFCPLSRDFLKANGILCEVVAFGSSTNAQLKERADSFLDLSSDPETFLSTPPAPIADLCVPKRPTTLQAAPRRSMNPSPQTKERLSL